MRQISEELCLFINEFLFFLFFVDDIITLYHREIRDKKRSGRLGESREQLGIKPAKLVKELHHDYNFVCYDFRKVRERCFSSYEPY